MSRLAALMEALGLSLAVVASGGGAERDAEQANVVAEIREFGGKVLLDEKSPGRPVKSVDYKSLARDAMSAPSATAAGATSTTSREANTPPIT